MRGPDSTQQSGPNPPRRAVLPRTLALALALALVAGSAVTTRALAAPQLPQGFVDEPVVTGIPTPTDIATLPDGSLLVASQSGFVSRVSGSPQQAGVVLDLTSVACVDSERGVLGVVADPAFATNRWIYVFYTRRSATGCETKVAGGPSNRVSRFMVSPEFTVDPASEVLLLDGMTSWAGFHNGGDVEFDSSGMLLVSTGDGGCSLVAPDSCAAQNDNARRPEILLGKILRIARDGSIPLGNPYALTGVRCHPSGAAAAGQVCAETWASGLRNPFRIAVDPAAPGRLFVNDVGQNTSDEIDDVVPGADYGWNLREGPCPTATAPPCGGPPAGLTDPIHSYGRELGCTSITGGAFVPDLLWPASYDRAYLFSDFTCGRIFALRPGAAGGWTASAFASGLGQAQIVGIRFAPVPHGGTALYYTRYLDGELRRIRFAGDAGRPPVAGPGGETSAGAPPAPAPLPPAATMQQRPPTLRASIQQRSARRLNRLGRLRVVVDSGQSMLRDLRMTLYDRRGRRIASGAATRVGGRRVLALHRLRGRRASPGEHRLVLTARTAAGASIRRTVSVRLR